MSILNIITIPNSEKTLRTKSEDIKIGQIKNTDMQKFFQDLVETMFQADGAGLAAPQVNKLIRAVAVNMNGDGKVFINPKLTKKSWGKCIIEEGCLSVPGTFGKVKRPKSVVAEYFDTEGNKHKEKLDKIPARVIQHEIDHLDGILFIDKTVN